MNLHGITFQLKTFSWCQKERGLRCRESIQKSFEIHFSRSFQISKLFPKYHLVLLLSLGRLTISGSEHRGKCPFRQLVLFGNLESVFISFLKLYKSRSMLGRQYLFLNIPCGIGPSVPPFVPPLPCRLLRRWAWLRSPLSQL